MRVLIVNSGMYVYGGAEILIVKLANYMSGKGIKNALLTTSIIPEMANDLKETEIIIQKKSNVPHGEMLALNKGIHNNLNNFDIINVHNYPAELSIFPYNKPTVWMCNEPILYLMPSSPSIASKLMKKLNLTFDRFVVQHYIRKVVVGDEFNAERFKKIYGLYPEIINYGIDYEFFSTQDKGKMSDRFNLNNNFVILQVGMLQPFKNQMESIKTIEMLKERIPNIRLVLAGWGLREYEDFLKKYVKEKELEENVIFTGHLDKECLRDLYHTCDVLLHPIKSQGGWLSPFEALCAKMPIVVSPEMTASNIIRREKIGIVTDSYVEAIWDIYNNPEKHHEMSESGKKWVINNLSWEKYSEKMVDLFIKIWQ